MTDRLESDDAQPNVYTLAPVTIQETAGGLEDVLRALQVLPGAAATNDRDGKLAVRGAGPEHNMVVVDGVQIHNPYRLGTFTSSFLNPATAASVKLDPSGLDARYGGRLSSVTIIDLRDGVSDRALAVSGSLGLMAGDLLLEGRLPGNAGASWWATARGTYYRPLFNRLSDDPVPGFADAQFKMTLLPTARTRLTVFGLVGREMACEPDADPSRRWSARQRGVPTTNCVVDGLAVHGNQPAGRDESLVDAGTEARRDDDGVDVRARGARIRRLAVVPRAPAVPARPPRARSFAASARPVHVRGGDHLLDAGVEVHRLAEPMADGRDDKQLDLPARSRPEHRR